MILTCVEVVGYINRENTPIYWRAWEYVSNYSGKDSSVAPFKPLSVYKKTMTGDLLNAIGFSPLPEEIKQQEFIVDEYGYRNRPGFLDEPIDALVIGSSFVAGGAETQGNLISEILTRDYGIRTYNYSTSVQYAYEDWRFDKSPPKYIFFVGTDGEVISSQWKYNIVERDVPINTPHKWNSYDEWKDANEEFPKTFEKAAAQFHQYSLVKYFGVESMYYLLNKLYSRDELARQTNQSAVSYESHNRTLYWQQDYDTPLLGSVRKSKEDIDLAIKVLLDSKAKLEKKNIRFIVVPMLSKTLSDLPKYAKTKPEDSAIVALNEAMDGADIEYIDIYSVMKKHKESTGDLLYYPADSHWSSETNYIISREIAKYVEEYE